MATALEKKQIECDKSVAATKADAAVKSALAAGWERDAQALQKKITSLEGSHQSLLDQTLGLKEKSAEAAGKHMVLTAEHNLRVSQLEQQLERCQAELEASKVAKAVMQSELKVCVHCNRLQLMVAWMPCLRPMPCPKHLC